jgi:hypothetical protein
MGGNFSSNSQSQTTDEEEHVSAAKGMFTISILEVKNGFIRGNMSFCLGVGSSSARLPDLQIARIMHGFKGEFVANAFWKVGKALRLGELIVTRIGTSGVVFFNSYHDQEDPEDTRDDDSWAVETVDSKEDWMELRGKCKVSADCSSIESSSSDKCN